ncbi:Caspase domain-containing protein [Beggiatoa alba B18LD]|uniref:Caspase domain-containing protein n=1 Tax=Beggiatoa alba B18LD TaxID=395493 RepID=I3CL25_9GAMM|nr:caspase family protein [Beggiatoa alba]EIJ44318.1 Caspase domain-containing protein [Beggiatoa alba B18LD]
MSKKWLSVLIKSSFIFCCFLWISSSFATTLHALLVIEDDYQDEDLNNIAQSIKVDYGNLSKFLKILDDRGIIAVKKTVLRGRQATLSRIKETIDKTTVAADDVILFYFSGHGGMEQGKTFLYTSDSANLDRQSLEKAVAAKNARLKIILTDACSNSIDGVVAMRSMANKRNAAKGQFDEVYRDLFLKHEGLLHLSASSEGEYAWSDNQLGGYFTYYFINEGLMKKPASSWEKVFTESRDKTLQMYGLLPARQRAELKTQGIKGQTPKAFALPTHLVTETNSTSTPAQPITPVTSAESEELTIENLTDKPVIFYRDIDQENEDDEDPPITLAPNEKINIPVNSVVYFQSAKDDFYYYDLETGAYYFDKDEQNQLDLYSVDAEDISDKPDADKQYQKLLTAEWEWDDGDSVVYTTLQADGKFIDRDEADRVITQGTWRIETTVDEEDGTYSQLIFELEEDGEPVRLSYSIDFLDDDNVRLELEEERINQEISEFDEDADLTVMLYRH